MLHVELFGHFYLTCEDQTITTVGTTRQQPLLAYLILHRGRPQPRQQIAFALWPDLSADQARNSLRRDLYRLRHLIPAVNSCLQIATQTLQWVSNSDSQVDIAEFEVHRHQATQAAQAKQSSIQQQHLEKLTQLYQGQLFPTCDDEWILPLRAQFHQHALQALEQLIQILEQQQEYAAAMITASQLLRFEPLHEGGFQALMRLHHAVGDRATALQIYYQCMTALRQEMGIDPSSTTQALYQQILTSDVSIVPPQSQSSPPIQSPKPLSLTEFPALMGRQTEWQIIDDWLSSHTPPSDSEVLLLLGEPGIGKTRLLEELTRRVEQQQGKVLQGQGFEAETLRPYGAWIDALRGFNLELTLPPELGSLLPETGHLPGSLDDRSRLFDVVITLLSQLAASTKLLVIFDDIQWLDAASISLLHYGIRLLHSTSIQFACSARSQALQQNLAAMALIQALRRQQWLRELVLPPLDRPAIQALIQPIDGSIDDDRIYHASGGNPLFALEAVRAFHSKEQENLSNLQALIADRLKSLEATAQTLLPWAATLGHQFEPMLLAQVMDCPLHLLLHALEQLETAEIIRPSATHEGCYTFAHDLVRQVLYQTLSVPRQQLMHGQIAQHRDRLAYRSRCSS